MPNRRNGSINDRTRQELSGGSRESQIAEALNSRFEKLNALWRSVEENLRQIPVHQPVYMNFAVTDEDGDEHERHCLAFRRSDAEWRICYAQGHFVPRNPEAMQWKPILDCSAEARLQSAKNIASLREEVIEQAESSMRSLDMAIASLHDEVDFDG